MTIELYKDKSHACILFNDLVRGEAVQANQFLIVDHNHAAIIDPGGELTYSRLYLELGNYVSVRNLDYIIASHQDPDIVASLNKWMVGTSCKAVVPELWERFIPHFTSPGRTVNRMISIPDQGSNLMLGDIFLKALPAHFLHAEGNFQFYDPISKILFSGDMGANLASGDLDQPFKKFQEAVPHMEGFHRRYMSSNKAIRYWANMIRTLDVEWMVPQHGRPFKGKKMIAQFLDWISAQQCGVDLITQDTYKVPDD